MEIYNYHAETKEYTGQGFADPSPLEPGVWLIPASATTIMPPAPQPGKVRCFDGARWVYADLPEAPQDPEYVPSLADLAAEKMAAIQAEKNRVRDGGFIHAGVRYDSDAEARLAYLELATKLAQDSTYSTPWKASAGAWVQMDAALFSALQPAYEAHISACFAWQGAREQEIAAALAMVTPALGPSTPALDEFGNQLFDENGAEIWNPGEPTGEMDESAARAALSAVAETM